MLVSILIYTMVKYKTEEEIKMVQYLRFRSRNPALARKTYMKYKDIGKLINKSVDHVHKMCKAIIKEYEPIPQTNVLNGALEFPLQSLIPKKKEHFTDEQARFLTSQTTLVARATKSLPERMMLFKRRYPEAPITIYKLRKLYEQHKIKKKAIRMTKIPDRATLEKITVQAADLANDVRVAMER